jgi:hypothetical protein
MGIGIGVGIDRLRRWLGWIDPSEGPAARRRLHALRTSWQ